MRAQQGLALAAALTLCLSGVALAQDDVVPMPVDVPPHHRGVLAGDRHFDISNAPEMVHHYGDHYVSFGHHNYDISDDPAYRDRYPFEESRWRGSGRGLERAPMLTWTPQEFDLPPERPWVATRIKIHGLRYATPEELSPTPPRFDRPTPSYYAVYKKRPRDWEKAVARWDKEWVPGAARAARTGRHRRRASAAKSASTAAVPATAAPAVAPSAAGKPGTAATRRKTRKRGAQGAK